MPSESSGSPSLLLRGSIKLGRSELSPELSAEKALFATSLRVARAPQIMHAWNFLGARFGERGRAGLLPPGVGAACMAWRSSGGQHVQQTSVTEKRHCRQVWVLDALPGEARAGSLVTEKRQDHPQDLIRHLLRLPMPLPDRAHLQRWLSEAGFSPSIQQWTSTNLRPLNGNRR